MQLYQTVTDRIIAELEQGAAPWLLPWRKSKANGRSLLPNNPITGHRYRGINVPILWAKQSDNGALESQIVIDTSQVATDTIDYVVTDPTGLTSTSTRTITVQAATMATSTTP